MQNQNSESPIHIQATACQLAALGGFVPARHVGRRVFGDIHYRAGNFFLVVPLHIRAHKTRRRKKA